MHLRFGSLFLLAFLLNTSCLYAQLKFGLTGGAGVGKLSGLESTIISEPYFVDYSLRQTRKVGWQAGAFIHYEIDDLPLAIYSEFSFSRQGTNLHFLNEQTNFSYDMIFNYDYANVLAMLRAYPFKPTNASDDKSLPGLYLGIGLHTGFIVCDRILYKSQNGLPEFGEDSYQSQQLERVLKGKTDFGVTAEIGYMFPDSRWDIGVLGHYSFTDVVEAMPNSYNFIENSNKNMFLQVVLKFALSGL